METESQKGKKKQWTTLSHNGVSFPEPYKSDPRTNHIIINGEKIGMTLEQEEMAVAWAKKKGTPYVDDSVFQTNFLSDFMKLFPERFRKAKISDITFPTPPEKVELSKEAKKVLAAERKKKRLELKEIYGYATVDGVRTEIANWVVEPPGLFMGRGCVSKDTLVKTIDGPKYVQELNPNQLIATHHGSDKMFYKPVASIAAQGVRPVYKLRTRTHSILATANHPFLSLRVERIPRRNSNGTFSNERFPAALCWASLSKLKVGDYVVTVKRYQTPGASKFSKSPRRTINGMIITPKFARLLGYYLGDGYIQRRGNGKGAGICFSEGHQKLIERYSRICDDVFGLNPTVIKHKGGNSSVIQIFSSEFVSAFRLLGITGTALTKRVPEWVFNLADDLKLAFLRGYIDADGHFSKTKINTIQYGSFGFESPNKRLIEEMRELAISAGLQTSNLTSRDGRGYAESTNYRFFINEYQSVTRLLDGDAVLEGYRTRFNSLDTRSNSLRTNWDWSHLRILDSDLYCLEKILEINEEGMAQTYDISMTDTRDPNFVANGFVVHNSHPRRGKWKPRITQKEITLNLGKEARAPEGDWKIVHEPQNMWIASWVDKLSEKVKYVWLHDSSSIRQARDKSKYDKAKKLEKDITRVRTYILKSLASKDLKIRQMATACFLIDKLAMRVGDEKDEDEADTVGASTLRVEHLKFNGSSIDFDFFGKDFVRWQKTLKFAPDEVVALEDLRQFCKGKKPDELIFDGITSRDVNEFFGKASPGLTAKVFRTFHATTVVKEFLKHHSEFPNNAPEYDKVFEAKLANLEAAIECNHKRTPPKTYEQGLEKKRERVRKLEATLPKTEKQKTSLAQRIEKAKRQLDLAEKTRDYNLNTSLRNYIDPRVYKNWADHVGLDWKVLYMSTLQRKMAWVEEGSPPSIEPVAVPAIQRK